MADVSDPKIVEALEQVRDDKCETNWMLLKYVDGKSNKLVVDSTGTKGLKEFTGKLESTDSGFGYLRITVSNDELSKRAKFVLVSWCGEDVPVMRKAKLSVHIASVKAICKSFAVQIAASDKNDLKEADVLLLLKKAMGANYDRSKAAY